MFVLDTTVSEEELASLCDSLQQVLAELPSTAMVGLISFGTMVTVHELSSVDCPKSFVLRGTKDYDVATVRSLLGVTPASAGPAGVPAGAGGMAGGAAASGNRFLAPVAECGLVVQRILEDLVRDPWPRSTDEVRGVISSPARARARPNTRTPPAACVYA